MFFEHTKPGDVVEVLNTIAAASGTEGLGDWNTRGISGSRQCQACTDWLRRILI